MPLFDPRTGSVIPEPDDLDLALASLASESWEDARPDYAQEVVNYYGGGASTPPPRKPSFIERATTFKDAAQKFQSNISSRVRDSYGAFKEELARQYNLNDPIYERGSFPIGSDPKLGFVHTLNFEGDQRYSPTMGSNVIYYPDSSYTDFAFTGPAGYMSAGNIKEEVKRIGNDALFSPDPRIREILLKEQADLKDKLGRMEHPFYRPFLQYQIGSALDETPIGGIVTQQPIGGKGKARDIIYSRLSNDALAMDVEGRRGARAKRLSPTKWLNVNQRVVDFDPTNLKVPAIQKAYGLPRDYNVDYIAADHKNLVKPIFKGNAYAPGAEAVFSDSPRLKLSRARLAGDTVSAIGAFPSAEVIKTYGEQGFIPGVRQQATEYAQSLPFAAAAAAAGYVAPLTTTAIVTPVGLGVGLAEGTRSVNELTRQLTGESLLSKTRQFLGTKPRTGYTERPLAGRFSKELDQINNPPTIKPNTNPQSVNTTNNKIPFNPLRLEFGISERLFGPDGRFKPFKGLGIVR